MSKFFLIHRMVDYVLCRKVAICNKISFDSFHKLLLFRTHISHGCKTCIDAFTSYLSTSILVLSLASTEMFGIVKEIDLEVLHHEDLRIVIVNSDIYSFIQALRRSYQWNLFRDLGQRNLFSSFTDNHGKIRIFNKITTFSIVYSQSNTSIAPILQLFFQTNLYIYILKSSTTYLIRLN